MINKPKRVGSGRSAGAGESAATKGSLVEVVGIQFQENPTLFYAHTQGIAATVSDGVIVDRGGRLAYAIVALAPHLRAEASKVSMGKTFKDAEMKLIRVATPKDLEKIAENTQKEQEALEICRQRVAEHRLEMKLIQAEYAFDRSKILFYFTADGRVDFRQLVKDLAAVFRTRIELRQVGVRDEAKMLGGIGVCGQSFCCKTFLNDFQPVSIKMAKEQGLSLSPTKISGTCGRLMCCLQYEQDNYEELMRVTPRIGNWVTTPEGNGRITDRNLLSGMVYVTLDDEPDAGVKKFPLQDVTPYKKKVILKQPVPPKQDEKKGSQ